MARVQPIAIQFQLILDLNRAGIAFTIEYLPTRYSDKALHEFPISALMC